jgi:hypothetical protein
MSRNSATLEAVAASVVSGPLSSCKQTGANRTHHKRPEAPKNALSDQLMLQWSRMYGSANGAASESAAAVLKNDFSRSTCEIPSGEGSFTSKNQAAIAFQELGMRNFL